MTVEGISTSSAATGLDLGGVTLLDVSNRAYPISHSSAGFVVVNGAGCVDADADYQPDAADNCPGVSNPSRSNSDDDALGDACDNCPTATNGGQENNDGDPRGDACDPDDDNDQVLDGEDNCIFAPNPGQQNTDGDTMGNECDPDDDNDSVLDADDNCSLAPNVGQENDDGDPYGNACDNCPTTSSLSQANSDADGLGDVCDNCPTTTNQDQANQDADGQGNACDADDDNDAFNDAHEQTCGSGSLDSGSRPERVDHIFTGVDDDADTEIDEALPTGASGFDCDQDGFTGLTENHVYQPNYHGDQDPCGANNIPPTVPASPIGWPADLRGGPFTADKVNVSDMGSFVAPVRYINTDVGTHPGDVRWDISAGSGPSSSDINIQDLGVLVVVRPPFFGGVRALNGPICPWAD
jgi:hypothetical protein